MSSTPLLDVPEPEPDQSSYLRRPGWFGVGAALVAGLLLGFLFAPREVQSVAVPVTTAAPAETDPGHEPEQAATIAVNNGTGMIKVSVETATVDAQGRAVVRAKVENIGKTPFESFYLDAKLEDDKGRRFAQRDRVVDDLAPNGEINPGESPVVTFRFILPEGAAAPAVLYVAETGGGEPAPVALP